MKTFERVGLIVVILGALALGGCARAARDTQGFALEHSATVKASFTDTWQAAKAVLREQDTELYTRDKRGVFVAYTAKKGHRLPVLHRTQYTVYLEEVSADTTRVTIETLRQVYGVTLLTYPGWHARKTTDDTQAQLIIEAIQAKLAGA